MGPSHLFCVAMGTPLNPSVPDCDFFIGSMGLMIGKQLAFLRYCLLSIRM